MDLVQVLAERRRDGNETLSSSDLIILIAENNQKTIGSIQNVIKIQEREIHKSLCEGKNYCEKKKKNFYICSLLNSNCSVTQLHMHGVRGRWCGGTMLIVGKRVDFKSMHACIRTSLKIWYINQQHQPNLGTCWKFGEFWTLVRIPSSHTKTELLRS